MKKIAAGQILHLGIIYLILSFFIFGSIYNRSLLANLGFGLFYTLSWLFCFFIPSFLYTDLDFKHFRHNWHPIFIQNFYHSRSNHKKNDLIFSVIFWLLQGAFVLLGLQLLQYNLMLLNILGIVGFWGMP